jgi:hypothetical protein
MKKLSLLSTAISAVISTVCLSASARLVTDLQGRFDMNMTGALSGLSRIPAGGGMDKSCQAFYNKMYADGTVSFSVGLGYFNSEGDDYTYMGKDYGDAVLDPFAYRAYINVLTARCSGSAKACGFKGRGGTLSKTVKTPSGRKINVVIHIANGGSSTKNSNNATPNGNMSAAQLQQSKYARSVFFGGIQNGTEVAIYMGHARSGGGPDFYAPRLLSNGHVNYGSYKAQQEGIGTLVSALRKATSAGRSPKIVAILACNSSGLFAGRMASASPGTMLITANSLFNDSDFYPTGLGVIDNVLNERCGGNFTSTLNAIKGSSGHLILNYTP